MSLVFDVTSIELDESTEVSFGAVFDTIEIVDAITTPDISIDLPNGFDVIEVQMVGVVTSGGAGGGGVTDHGDLTGLSDDDHPQYLTNTRGDARYYTKAQSDEALSGKSDVSHIHDGRYYTESETDALLSGKANTVHTHTSGSVTDFAEAVQDSLANFFNATGATFTYDDANNQMVVNVPTGGGGTTDPEVVRDTIGAALIGIGNISVVVNDAADTITISTTATQNSTDAALRDRSTHTGTQSADTLTDGTTNKAFLATERTKLAGVATGATANSSDATLLSRANHTGSQPASTISDSTTVGRSVLTAADAAAARTAIGAGTSNLILGTTGTTAKAGDYVPSWTEITSKPSTFAPSAHTHIISDVTNLQSALDGKAAVSHTHTTSQISDSTTVGRSVLTAADAAAARTAIGAGTSDLIIGTTSTTAKAGDYVPSWSEITSKPSTFTPSAHTHVIADVTNLQTTLDSKANSSLVYTKTEADNLLATKRANKNGTTVLTVMNTDMAERIDIESDGTASSGWTDRLQYRYKPSGGTARNVFTLNEYGEVRITPALTNTVGFRMFAREFATDPARDMSVPLMEIYNDRTNRVTQFAVYGDGDIYTKKDLQVDGVISSNSNIVAPNIGLKIEPTIYNSGSEPASAPTGTVILVRP